MCASTQTHTDTHTHTHTQAEEAAKDHARLVAMDPSHTKRVCPYLDSLFPSDSVMLHRMEDLTLQIHKAPHGRVPKKTIYRNVAKKLARLSRVFRASKAT